MGDTMINETGHRSAVDAAFELDFDGRTPVNNFSNIVAAHSAGYQFKDVRNNAKASAESSLRYAKLTHSDFVKPVIDSQAIFQDIGVKVTIPDDNYCRVSKPLAPTPEDVDALAVYDPFAAEECPLFTDSYVANLEGLSSILDEDFHVCGFSWGPLTMAGYIRGADQLLMDSFLEPELADRMISKVTRFTADIQRKCIDCGATVMWMSDPTASQDLISPDEYRRFELGPVAEVIRRVKDFADVPVMIHMCGETTDTMRLLPDIGVDCFSCDTAVDLAVAKANIGDRMALMGNVAPVNTLMQGTPEDVRRESYECIEKAGLDGGFILSSGCEIPRDTPDENTIAMGLAGSGFWRDRNRPNMG